MNISLARYTLQAVNVKREERATSKIKKERVFCVNI